MDICTSIGKNNFQEAEMYNAIIPFKKNLQHTVIRMVCTLTVKKGNTND
jgi:hypothetical protein